MPETQSLAQTITRGEHLSAEPAATPIQSSLKSNPGTGNPPPLGCDREAELLSNCWDDAARGRGSLVVLSGDAGVGKGNLIRWVKDQVTHSGSLVLDGACYQFERTLPYQPIIEMLRTAAGALQHTGLLPAYRALVARLVPEILETAGLAGSDTELLSGDLRIQLYEAMLQAFLSLARETPLLLAFEHVHWASESTLDWLTYSAPRLAHSRILVLITCRTSEIGADHALRRLEGRFTRDGLVRSLSLHPFNRETTRAWIARESNLTGPRLEQVADCLFQETGGNLFYLQELVCGLQEAGQIVTGSREWSGRFVDETPCTEAFIPESLRSAILARVARLPDRPRKILKTAAVAGDPFLYDVVRDAEGWSDDDALDALEEIIQRGFIREGGRPGVYGFTHHLVEEALYADMSLLRRAHRHRAVAQAIQARHPHDDEALAYHFERAGEVDQARQFHLRAAEHALELGSSIDASDHYRAALRLWPAGDPAGRSEIAARLGVP